MDDLHRDFLDIQIKRAQIDRLRLELELAVMGKALSMPTERICTWDPYGNRDVLAAIRASRMSIMSTILFDLDGYEDMPEGRRRELALLGLLDEARGDFVSTVIGFPQTFYRSGKGDDDGCHVIRWDFKPYCEIPIPAEEIEPVFSSSKAGKGDDVLRRHADLDYSMWTLMREWEMAGAFLEYADGGGSCSIVPGRSWVVDRVAEGMSHYELDVPVQDPVLEVVGYMRDVADLGWTGDADADAVEELLLDIAARKRMQKTENED